MALQDRSESRAPQSIQGWKLVGSALLAGITAVLGAVVGLLGSIYSQEIKSSWPFGEASFWRVGEALELNLPVCVFYLSLFALGFLIFVNMRGQGRAYERSIDHLDRLMRDQGKAYDTSIRHLDRLIRTVPPSDYLKYFEDTLLESGGLTAFALGPRGDPAALYVAINSCLASLGELARGLDECPEDVRFGVNLMCFVPYDNSSVPLPHLDFWDGGDQTQLEGYLQLLPEFSICLTSEETSLDETVPPLLLPIPKPEFSQDTKGRTLLLPGAPHAYRADANLFVWPDTAEIPEWCRRKTGFRPTVADDLEAYFRSAAGQHVKSFVSVPIFSPSETDGVELQVCGIVNIHSNRTGVLGAEGPKLFLSLTAPYKLMLGALLARWKLLPSAKREQVVSSLSS